MHTPEERFYAAVVVTAIVLGLIIGYFILTMIRHQRRNVQLYRAKIKAEIAAQEKERKRIASDLHDELGPVISAVKLQINHLECRNEEDKLLIDRSNRYIDDIVNKIREISYNLLPNTLVRSGLIIAVCEYVERLSKICNLNIDIQYDNAQLNMTKEEEINIYRIIQEIIHNTIKHAKATSLSIQFKVDHNKLYLITTDNGIGFDFDRQSAKNAGLGLYNLQSRAEVINAKFSFQSETTKGTKFIFEIPVN